MTSPLVLSRLPLRADGSLVFIGYTASSDYPVSPDTSPPPGRRPRRAQSQRLTTPLFVRAPAQRHSQSPSVITGDGNTFYLVGSSTVGDLASNATLNAQGLNGFLALVSTSSYPFLASMDLSARVFTYLGPLVQFYAQNALPRLGSAITPDGSLLLAAGSRMSSMNFTGQKQPLLTAVFNPASLLTSPLTPGEVIEVRGTGFLPGASALTAPDPSNPPLETCRYSTHHRWHGSPVAFSQEQLDPGHCASGPIHG